MGQLVQDINMILTLVEVIKGLAEQFEVPGFGKEKKEAVLNVLGTLCDNGWIAMPKDRALSIGGALIDIVVAFYNLIGKFKHSA